MRWLRSCGAIFLCARKEMGTPRRHRLDMASRPWRLKPQQLNLETWEIQAMDAKSVIIGVLFVAVVVLGYLLYDANQTKVKIDLPGVKIEGR